MDYIKVHKVQKSNQKVWLETSLDVNIKLRTEPKNRLNKNLINLQKANGECQKAYGNTRLLKIGKRRMYLVSESNHPKTNWFLVY